MDVELMERKLHSKLLGDIDSIRLGNKYTALNRDLCLPKCEVNSTATELADANPPFAIVDLMKCALIVAKSYQN